MKVDLAHDLGFPFSDFETDETAYSKARLFWQTAFDEALGSDRLAWRDWMPDPFKDGHPIFSALDGAGRRGVLLQQVRPSDDRVWFKCWVAEVGEHGSAEAIPYLFMETFVSNEGRRLFEDLVCRWCAQGTDKRSMELVTEQVMREAAGSPVRLPASLHHTS